MSVNASDGGRDPKPARPVTTAYERHLRRVRERIESLERHERNLAGMTESEWLWREFMREVGRY